MVSPSQSLFQSQRFELKYIISDELATRIRDFLSAYMSLDSFGASQPNCSYPVHSLYLDSPDLVLHQSTINGDKNRYKLRIRFYENRPTAPVYFEIKRRVDNAIFKERCPVKRDGVHDIIVGRYPEINDLAEFSEANELALEHFVGALNRLQARPVAHVAYLREAWMCESGNRIRVTMDRDVRSCPENSASLKTDMIDPVLVFGNEVVLELKFSNRYPAWMGEMVRIFGLRQCSAAKYVDGIVQMEERNLIQARPRSSSEIMLRGRRMLRQLKALPGVHRGRLATTSND